MGKAFNPDDYLKTKSGGGGFNPDEYLATKSVPEPRGAQALAAGVGNGLTLGHSAQLGAAIAPVIDKGINFFTGLRTPDDTYVQRRDENIASQNALKESNPGMFGAGEVAGSLASTAVPGGIAAKLGLLKKGAQSVVTAEQVSKLAKAASLAKPVGEAGAIGATIAGLQNPGDVEGEVSPIQFGQRVDNAKVGTLIGAGAKVGLDGLSKIANTSGAGLKSLAEIKAFKSTGAVKKHFDKAYGKGKVNEIGRQLLDDEVVTAGATPKKIGERLTTLIDDSTKTIETAIQKLDKGSARVGNKPPGFLHPRAKEIETLQASYFRPAEVAERLKNEIREKYKHIPEEKLSSAFDEIDSYFAKKPQVMPISDVHAMKKEMGLFLKDSDFHKASPTPAKIGTLAVRRGLKEGVEKQADTVSKLTGGAGGEVKTANRRLGNYLETNDIVQDRLARDASNRAFGLTDNIMGAGGVASGSGATGLALMGASKLARTFGNSVMATGFDAVSNQLLKVPKYADLAKNNPEQFQMLVNKLTQEQGNDSAISRKLNQAK